MLDRLSDQLVKQWADLLRERRQLCVGLRGAPQRVLPGRLRRLRLCALLQEVLCELIGESIKKSAKLIGEPVKG